MGRAHVEMKKSQSKVVAGLHCMQERKGQREEAKSQSEFANQIGQKGGPTPDEEKPKQAASCNNQQAKGDGPTRDEEKKWPAAGPRNSSVATSLGEAAWASAEQREEGKK